MKNKLKKGFTLIELLIVIGIIAILAGIVLVSINPAAQFERARNAGRLGDAGNLLKAFIGESASPGSAGNLTGACQLDPGGGAVDTDIPDCGVNFAGAYELGTPATDTVMDCSAPLTPGYLSEMPVDADSAYTAANSGYAVCQDTSGATPVLYILSLGSSGTVDATEGECLDPADGTTPVLCVSG